MAHGIGAQRDPDQGRQPRRTIPYVTYLLIATNVGVFALQVAVHVTRGLEASTLLVLRGGAIPIEITRFADLGPTDFLPPPLTLLSCMFLHGGVGHLLGNMLYLWVFGDNVEDSMGHGRFLAFYMGTGLAASLAHVAGDPRSAVPVVGASGAISGVLGAYILLFPRARVLTVIPIFVFLQFVHLPAFLFLGLWFLLQVLSANVDGRMPGSGVAFLAHIGGFVAGLLTVPLFKRRRRRRRIG